MAPAPFNKTTVIAFAPKYVIVNKLDYPILVQQRLAGSVQSGTTLVVRNHGQDKHQELHLQAAKKSSPVSNHIQFAIQTTGSPADIPPPAQFEDCWSKPFSVEKFEDFNAKVKLYGWQTPQQPEKQEWYQPSSYTDGYQFVRVSVTPSPDARGDATLFIILSNPAVEEFVIKNQTHTAISFCNYDFKAKAKVGRLASLHPFKSTAFAWDLRDLANKYVWIQVGNRSKSVSLDKASQLDENRQLKPNGLFVIDNEQFYTTLKIKEEGTKVLSIKSKQLAQKQN